MPEPATPARKAPLSSLATKIIFLVFVSTLLTALVVSWISVQSTHAFLRSRMDRTFPARLEVAATRLEAQLDRAQRTLETTAAGLDAARLESGPVLDVLLRDLPEFTALTVHDVLGPRARAEERAGSGGRPALRIEVPLVRGAGSAPRVLTGEVSPELLRAALGDVAGPGARLYLVDPRGRVIAGPEDAPARLAAAALPGEDGSPVRDYLAASGEHVVGAVRSVGHQRAHLVLQEPFEAAFAPVFAVVTRVFVIDVCIILLFSFLAYQITSTIVRPIEALSEGARQIAEGELDVELADPGSQDEVGLLTRSFNAMVSRLRDQRREVEATHEALHDEKERLERANEILEQLSITDGLTKLHNHRFFQDHLTREIKRVDRSGEHLSMLMIDIDDFKQLNDRLGHAAGDALLLGIARIMNETVRETDLLARYGGEEFVVVAAADREGAYLLAEKIRTAVAEASFVLEDSPQRTRVTVSIGLATFDGNRKTFFQRADRALYRAKAAGKNCVMIADDEITPIV